MDLNPQNSGTRLILKEYGLAMEEKRYGIVDGAFEVRVAPSAGPRSPPGLTAAQSICDAGSGDSGYEEPRVEPAQDEEFQ
ncbi:hypothetical protein Vi05172_g7249 [Venturia inaequalis]|nr:hypothetical protein Vi05172_g7249 [Venturia inaequalis]